jgi:hypothetical protein
MQMPRLASKTETVEKADQRTPYCSRISSARPLPVTAHARGHLLAQARTAAQGAAR